MKVLIIDNPLVAMPIMPRYSGATFNSRYDTNPFIAEYIDRPKFIKETDVILNKLNAVLEVCTCTANKLTASLKQTPNTTKFGRNIFIKSYNRRPNNKQKTSRAILSGVFSGITGAMQLAMIQATPLPKFNSGSNTYIDDDRIPVDKRFIKLP